MPPEQTENPLAEMKPPSAKNVIKNLLFIGITIGVAYFVTVTIGIENVRQSVEKAGWYAPFIIILLKATTIVVVPLGGTPLYPIAGALYGFWKAIFITLIGDALGATIAFYISRFFGISVLHFFMSGDYLPMIQKIMERGAEPKRFWKARFFFAGFPELFAYAAGLTRVSYPLFIFAYISVHAIGASLLVVFGDLLVSGNIKAVIIAGTVSTLLAFAGIWWFKVDLQKAS